MDSLPSARRPRRVLVWSVLGVGLLVVAVGVTLALRNANGDGPSKKKKRDTASAAPVELARVGRDDISTYLETTTTLEPTNTAILVARRQGQITSLPAEEGQWVKQGQTLAQLDNTEARIALAKAQLTLDAAQHDLDRGKKLTERSMLSTKDLDDLELKKRSAGQEVEQAKYDLTQTRIVAPFSGRVVDRMVNLGETVTPGKECFRVCDFEPLRARVYFPERDLARVKVGQEAMIAVDTQPGKQFTAHVALVNPSVDTQNGTFKVTLEVKDPSGTLRPGSFCRVKLRTGTFADALVISRRAVISEDGDNFVFVARGDSVNRIKVALGAASGDTVQILQGISPGESVVTVGQGGLKQGSKIKPVTF